MDNLPMKHLKEIPYKHDNWKALRVTFDKYHTIISFYYIKEREGSEDVFNARRMGDSSKFTWKHYQ